MSSNDEMRPPKVVHTYGKVDRDYGMRMFTMSPDDDGPVFMVNFMKYKEVADYGVSAGDQVSGREADDRYAPVDVLGKIGAYVAFHGDVVDQSGSLDPRWDRIGVVCYPTRKSFLDMQNRDDFRDKHVHKAAGMDQTFVIGCLPRDGVAPGDFRREDKGRGVIAVSAHRAVGEASRDGIAAALVASRRHASANGCETGQWYDCEGTIMGDGRSFDMVCFDRYPDVASWRAAQSAMAADPACAALFDAAKNDSYAVAVDAAIDRITLR
jgi:hypothetical protein